MREPLVKQPYNGCPGCLFLLGLVVALFLAHGLFIYAQAFVNEAKWNDKGPRSYTISAAHISFGGPSGTLRVENGKVVDVQPSILSEPLYRLITIEGIFEQIRGYAFSPWAWETVNYDAEYGYPKEVRFNFWSSNLWCCPEDPVGIYVYDLSFGLTPSPGKSPGPETAP